MNEKTNCPVCRNVDGGHCNKVEAIGENMGFDCSICGRFEASNSAYNWLMAFKNEKGEPEELDEISTLERALISHKLRISDEQDKPFPVEREWIEQLRATNSYLPSRSVQAINMIRFVGDEMRRSGEDLEEFPVYLHAFVGAPRRQSAFDLALELRDKGLLKLKDTGGVRTMGPRRVPINLYQVSLTLDGWERYEDERQGRVKEDYGFVAMQFGDPQLESFVDNVLKPAIEESGYSLIDMRDVAQSGVIDNIMRTQIRDSRFVISDLTHDNPGAYWEAGYAEGLGKPVIYICEKEKFDANSTHFDTNHCTTVLWSPNDPDTFCKKLIATVRRSLN